MIPPPASSRRSLAATRTAEQDLTEWREARPVKPLEQEKKNKIVVQFCNSSNAMETRYHSKNGASLKSQMSKGYFIKKVCYAILAIVSMVFIGCVGTSSTSTVKFENQQQQNFDDFLAEKRKLTFNQANDIQRKEFNNQFEKELFDYIDSVKLFVNWEGTIKDIKTKESGKSTAIEFEIYYKPEEHREIRFLCTHIVETANLETDYIYNQVKNISNYTTVYFDGLIRTNNKKQVYYDFRSVGDELNIPYPQYRFWIVDIGTTKRNNNLSENLQNAVNFCYNMVEPLRLQFLNQISKGESDKTFNKLLPEFENLKSLLTDNEKLYVQRVNTSLIYNFMYGN